MKINESDIAAEFETLRDEINELRQHVLNLTEVVQGINNVLHDLNKQVIINTKL
jgi:prefoldin subunit 5